MSEWIDAKLNPPKEDGRYLVVDDLGFRKWIRICSLINGEWDTYSIIYYQELPLPPKDSAV